MRHGPSRPVFVDRTGRRRRIVLLTGVGLATLLVSGLAVLGVGLSAGSGWTVPGFPDANNAVDGPGAEPTPMSTPGATATVAGPNPAVGGTVEPTRSSPRRVPTQTPSHQLKPTKT
jgi:hypothetical protein